MANHERVLQPGEAQARRMWFTLRLLGIYTVTLFLLAATVGLAAPGVWASVFAPVMIVWFAALMICFVWFFVRMWWFRAKAKHYATMMKLRNDPDFK